MNLQGYSALILVVTAVLALFVASPALEKVLVSPQTEFFTELYLLGSGHLGEGYPSNLTRDVNYNVFLDVANNLGSCAYYQVEVKFINETQSAPDIFNRTSSSLPSLYNFTVFVADKEKYELPMEFAFNYSFSNVTRIVYSNVTVSNGLGNSTIEQRAYNVTVAQVNFDSVKVNGVTLNLQGYSSDWNPRKNEFVGNLVFELWIYNSTINSFQYHERFVNLRLNMTATPTARVS